MSLKRATAVVVSAALFTLSAIPSASAMEPLQFDPERHRPPEAAAPAPPVPMRQTNECATNAVLDNSQFNDIPAQTVFDVESLHKFATGSGVSVAVIDSGVAPNVRLPRLRGAGDYIMGGDGLEDCDHHGTLIAGLIGASPASGDGFVGVAPGADLISIRQSSRAFGPENRDDEAAASTVGTLASAVRRAADEGADVINMSVTSCISAAVSDPMAPELMGALAYAALERDVVLVASAGNLSDNCGENPGPDPAAPDDDRGWDRVNSVSLPSAADEFVLSVGGQTLLGDPYIGTMPGPWVDVAAPAVSIVSLDPADGDNGGLINAELGQDGPAPLSGTSFAAAYVTGLAALIRERNPGMGQQQVREQIIATAGSASWSQNNVHGHGPVQPVRALAGRSNETNLQGQGVGSTALRETYQPPVSAAAPMIIGMSLLGIVIITIAGGVIVQLIRKGDRG